ncbi:MAG: hypothetical protein M3O41_03590 [Pseudomonadota bacterium]|nr:hypothetical protein [Pseudomonadota bacterium]
MRNPRLPLFGSLRKELLDSIELPGWDGHKPVTSSVLLGLLTTAHTGKTRFSNSQRVLFTACEFWAAAQNRTLVDHLGEAMESRLGAAELSFSVIGLNKTAMVLKRARMQLVVDASAPVEQIIEDMEDALSAIDEPVDRAIELFAKRELSAG